jgi:hypothetical protein
VNDLELDPSQLATIYAATSGVNGGIFKSVNGAATWTKQNTGLPNTVALSVAVHPFDSSIVYAGISGAGFYKSINGSESWAASNTGLTNLFVVAIAIDSTNPLNMGPTTPA